LKSVLFISFICLLNASIGWANDELQEEDSCEKNETSVINLLKTSCDEILEETRNGITFRSEKRFNSQKNARYCECLIAQKDKNILISARLSQYDDADGVNLEKAINENKTQYFQRLDDVYEKMTVGAEVEKQILKIKSDQKEFVGCTAERMSKDIKNKLNANSEKHIEAIDTIEKEYQKELSKCERKTPGNCEEVKKIIKRAQLNKSKLVSMPDCLEVYAIGNQLRSSEDYKEMNSELSGFFIKSESLSPQICQFYKKKISNELDKLETKFKASVSKRGTQCERQDLICRSIELKNNRIANKIETEFGTPKKNQCITRAEFEAFRSMPSKNLLAKFAESSNPAKLLDLTESDDEATNFLRSNPLIAKMATDSTLRGKIGRDLKRFANETKQFERNDPRLFMAYLGYMKNDVAQLIDKKENRLNKTEAYICEELTNNFTAISLANDLPEIEKKQESDNEFTKIDNCSRWQFNKSASSDLQESLKTSPIFNLGLDQKEKESLENEFESLNTKWCQGYEIACPDQNENCRENFLKQVKTPSASENKDEDTGPIPSIVKALEDKAIDPVISKEEIDSIRQSTDKNKQDQEFWSWWDQKIKPKLGQVSPAIKGDSEKLKFKEKSDSQIVSDEEEFENEITKRVPQTSKTKNGFNSKPNLIAPGFSQARNDSSLPLGINSNIKSSLLRESTSSAKRTTNNNDASDGKKDEGLDEQEEKIKQKIDEESLQSAKLQNLDQKIKDEVTPKVEGPTRSPSSITPASSVSSAAGAQIQKRVIKNYSTKTRKITSQEAINRSRNDALIQINEKSSLKVKEGFVDSKEFKGPQSASMELIVEDEDYFNVISEDPKEMEKFLKKELVGLSVGESKIITVSSKSSDSSAFHYYLRVKHTQNGEFEIQSVPLELPVQRVSTLKALQIDLSL
jgi:hypothetical protein